MLRSILSLTAFAALASVTSAASSLADAPTAFLRAHAESPVNWTIWSDEALARATEENKPVFVFVGSFTSELSRAMREQTFARAEVAEKLNENFVCVLVDRELQPDVASLYQAYVRAAKQLNGWPLNIWLTPELMPFDGATYLPPTEEWGKEGFPVVLDGVVSAWQSDPDAARGRAKSDLATVRVFEPEPLESTVDRDAIRQLLSGGAEEWMARFDHEHSGFGDLPKYPQPELLRFLLQAGDTGREAALRTLRVIATSPLHDPLDGGFFRYAGDQAWLRPSFQKTLADQARLALAYLDAAKVSQDAHFGAAARQALDYALSRGNPAEGFAGAEDGTPPDIPATFLWTYDEIHEVLGAEEAAAFCRAFGVTPEGNLEADAYLGVETVGKNLLHRVSEYGDDESEARLRSAAAKLLERRQQRPSPLRDDHATSGAHGLLLTALARAGSELSEPRFANAAQELAAFIRENLCMPSGVLRRVAGQPHVASPGDFASVIDGLQTYAAASADSSARELALTLKSTLQDAYWNATTGRYFALSEPVPTGAFLRVHVPAPPATDLPGAETAALLAFVSQPDHETSGALASAQAAEINASFDPARGDQLLALQRFAQESE